MRAPDDQRISALQGGEYVKPQTVLYARLELLLERIREAS